MTAPVDGIENLDALSAPERNRPMLETFSGLELLKMELPEPRYACADLIVEGLSFLAGKPKIGKSWMGLQLAVAVVIGGRWLGNACERGSVLYLALEDSRKRLQSRLQIVLAGTECPSSLHLTTKCPRLNEGGIDLISSWLEAHPDARLVIIDTLAKVKPHRGKHADIYAEDGDVGTRLQALAFKHHIALVVLTHTRKAFAEDFLEEVSGTLGLTGAADSVLVLKRDRNAPDGTLHVTGRDIDERELALSFTRETLWVGLGAASDVRMSVEQRQILDLLRTWEADGSPAMTPAQIARELGKNRNTVRVLLRKMKAEGHVRQGLKSGTYVPTSYTPATP
jgi:DNA-binding CsgD family transcriptional regulator